jgi:hypothetical protein
MYFKAVKKKKVIGKHARQPQKNNGHDLGLAEPGQPLLGPEGHAHQKERSHQKPQKCSASRMNGCRNDPARDKGATPEKGSAQ